MDKTDTKTARRRRAKEIYVRNPGRQNSSKKSEFNWRKRDKSCKSLKIKRQTNQQTEELFQNNYLITQICHQFVSFLNFPPKKKLIIFRSLDQIARKGIKPYTSFEKILIYIYLKKGITNQSHFLHKNTLDQDLINLLTLFI